MRQKITAVAPKIHTTSWPKEESNEGHYEQQQIPDIISKYSR